MTAPLYAGLAQGPQDGFAEWLTAADGRRIRAGVWGMDAARRGTVFLFPGRTEYVEKYGLTAASLAARGYATLTVDWRGQGLASRVLRDPVPGHVEDFAEFQLDVQALVAFARARGLAEPWFLLAHSMGGCIGLRTLMGTHPFRAAAFSAPMWGISIPAWQRPLAEAASWLATRLGAGAAYAPLTGPAAYVTSAPFEGNTLTTDRAMWDYMGNHLRAEPSLHLGGPTMAWLRAALDECRALAALPSPALAAHVGLGSHERVVDPAAIHARMARWPGGRLQVYPRAEHELLMERGREAYLDAVTAVFAGDG
jgi:lysophospholipase